MNNKKTTNRGEDDKDEAIEYEIIEIDGEVDVLRDGDNLVICQKRPLN